MMRTLFGAATPAFATLACLAPTGGARAHAFDSMDLPPEGVHAHLAVSGAYRTRGLVGPDERWTVPGTLMGGEAHPFEAGLSLDEVFLSPVYRSGATYAALKVGRHASAHGLELDHALVGHQFTDALAVEGGRLASALTPFHGEHPSDGPFSSRRLAYDVLWGGGLVDEGARLKTRVAGIDAGVEAWRGNAFPSRHWGLSEPALDAYIRYGVADGGLSGRVGGYVYGASPQRRGDARYDDGHSHGPSRSDASAAPTLDGTVRTFGGFGGLAWEPGTAWSAGAQGEATRSTSNGRLRDATREADFENTTLAFWGETWLRWEGTRLAARSERLKVNNTVRGAAAPALSRELGFLASRKDPYRHTVGVEQALDANARLRAEWMRDFTTTRPRHVFVLGAVWTGMVFHAGPHEDRR
jgi:hypothetical protein